MKTKKQLDAKIATVVKLIVEIFTNAGHEVPSPQSAFRNVYHPAIGRICTYTLLKNVTGYSIGFDTAAPMVNVFPAFNECFLHDLLNTLTKVALEVEPVSVMRRCVSEETIDSAYTQLTNIKAAAKNFVGALRKCKNKAIIEHTGTRAFGVYTGRDALELALSVFSTVVDANCTTFTYEKFFKHLDVSLYVASVVYKKAGCRSQPFPEPSLNALVAFYKDFPKLLDTADKTHQGYLHTLDALIANQPSASVLFYICK